MKTSTLAEAKTCLPLPVLMANTGYGQHAKKSAKCFAHADSRNSFSVFRGNSGTWRFKCFGCGITGDEITFLELVNSLSTKDAIAHYIKLAGMAPPRPSIIEARPPRPPHQPTLHAGTAAELNQLGALRHIGTQGLALASDRGLLRFGKWRGEPAWFVLDSDGRNMQARRLDGQPWPQGCKALTLPGSQAAWPLGTRATEAYSTVLFVEGGPDLLAGHHFIITENRAADTCVVAMLGASLAIPAEALPHFSGKRVRFFTHADAAGRNGVTRWAHQLFDVGATVDAFGFDGYVRSDGLPVEDLNDAISVSADDFEEHRELRSLIPAH